MEKSVCFFVRVYNECWFEVKIKGDPRIQPQTELSATNQQWETVSHSATLDSLICYGIKSNLKSKGDGEEEGGDRIG